MEGKLMTPHQGNAILSCSSQHLPRLCLGPLTHFEHSFLNYRETRTPSSHTFYFGGFAELVFFLSLLYSHVVCKVRD